MALPDMTIRPDCRTSHPVLSQAGLRTILAHQVQEGKKFQPHGKSFSMIISNAGSKALGGGLPGAAAMAVQVVSLMWMRTTINYQYRYGMGTLTAFKTLYRDGGVLRFYHGFGPALIHAPLSRFGDTAANNGVLALLDSYEGTYSLPVAVKTLAASLSAGAFRIMLMPIDTVKSMMQVEGKTGLASLVSKVRVGGVRVMFHGALAASAATVAGHYPWFAVYNYLNAELPRHEDNLARQLMRSAGIGFCASAVSDTVSNSIRVLKTSKQTATVPTTYLRVVQDIVAKDGVLGLMGRGLVTKLISNGTQSMLFSVVWRLGQDHYAKWERQRPAPDDDAAVSTRQS